MGHLAMHRGSAPEDPVLFAPERLAVLTLAAEEVSWLLTRGYPETLAIRAAGDRHQLTARQRFALARACCSDGVRAARIARAVEPSRVRGTDFAIDGFNVIVTLEVALGGGVLVRGREGALRDLAGMRGSYKPVGDTAIALDLLGSAIHTLAPASCTLLFDAAVSNSGRLRAMVLDAARHRWSLPVEATLVPDPDPLLSQHGVAATADGAVIDRCTHWFNLAAWIVDRAIPGVFCIDPFASER